MPERRPQVEAFLGTVLWFRLRVCECTSCVTLWYVYVFVSSVPG